ncbi:uncharacterized protein [Drosophila suzukii]|uniref:Peptidase A2 domain-containing protein n=1 Tax=Drosophila suzukii TaxID=28584 RepID=A0ABM4TNF1_DROSZ
MALTETNYSVAWNLVVKRYNNPRLQFMYNMNALYGIEPLSKEIAVDHRNLLNLANLEVFLHNRLVSIDLIESRKPAVPVRSSIQSTNHRQTTRPSGNSIGRGHSFHSTLESGSIRCSLCQQNHVLRRCPDFLAKDCFARKVIVDRSKACINCLSASHSLSQCSSNRNCSQCGQRHHTLLHFPNAQQSSSLTPEVSRQHALDSGRSAAAVQNAPSTQLFSAVASHLNSTTLLATALVRIVNNSTGQSALVRALIDHGSEGTLITENIVQALRLKRHPVRAEITGVGNTSHNQCRHSTDFTIISCSGSDFNAYVSSVFILRSLTDPNFIKSGRIDLLIGVDIIPQLMLPDIRKGTIKEVKGSEEEHTRINAQRQLSISACTVPHHAVIKDDSLTTKMRVVYDASCKTSNGRSLNDILCTGPALQNDLGGVILNWRVHRYVFVADITKMYRCIDMHEEDAQYQRIFWRDEKGLIKEYFLTTIASDERERYPLVEHVLKKEIYVDDVQTGHETIDGALKIRNDVIAALQSAGMELKKWASNLPDILESIPTTDLSNSSIFEIDSPALFRYLNFNRLCSHWCGWFNKKSIRKNYQDYDPTNFYPNTTNSASYHRFSTMRGS